jgi:hypothetical protein
VAAVASDSSASATATHTSPATIVARSPIRMTSRMLRALAYGISAASGRMQTADTSGE